jgi:hypothetical protein
MLEKFGRKADEKLELGKPDKSGFKLTMWR